MRKEDIERILREVAAETGATIERGADGILRLSRLGEVEFGEFMRRFQEKANAEREQGGASP